MSCYNVELLTLFDMITATTDSNQCQTRHVQYPPYKAVRATKRRDYWLRSVWHCVQGIRARPIGLVYHQKIVDFLVKNLKIT